MPRDRTEHPLATPAEHARAMGTRSDLLAAAAVLHGWAEHEHHTADPIRMTADAFAAAVEAVDARPCLPHGPALSPYRGVL